MYLQVLEVSTGKLGVCDNLDFSFALLANLYRVAQITNTIVNLDFVVQELFEGGNVKDLI